MVVGITRVLRRHGEGSSQWVLCGDRLNLWMLSVEMPWSISCKRHLCNGYGFGLWKFSNWKETEHWKKNE
ncbi:hypothetical protein SLA2020_267980 [Shorea laevis]